MPAPQRPGLLAAPEGHLLAHLLQRLDAQARQHGLDGLSVLLGEPVELGEACSWVRVDLTREADAESMVVATVQQFGRLDIGINAAGIGSLVAIVDQTSEQWNAVQDLDLRGVFLSTKHEARQMIAQGGGGAIVNIASINARQPAEGLSAYCSAKAGVEMFTVLRRWSWRPVAFGSPALARALWTPRWLRHS